MGSCQITKSEWLLSGNSAASKQAQRPRRRATKGIVHEKCRFAGFMSSNSIQAEDVIMVKGKAGIIMFGLV
jgi:hypothetical protein